MQLRYSFRLDPAPAQRIALARAFGCAPWRSRGWHARGWLRARNPRDSFIPRSASNGLGPARAVHGRHPAAARPHSGRLHHRRGRRSKRAATAGLPNSMSRMARNAA
ncbi:helix-turn-helix domain-containing protein [Nonomuraea sp. NPDC049480]|uniref:helix-turn-helix domain-containing protein n=1 Tax=Nonomuraea sp. NPDC049480 TaxID=3364353 RepID=UPI0037AFCFFC